MRYGVLCPQGCLYQNHKPVGESQPVTFSTYEDALREANLRSLRGDPSLYHYEPIIITRAMCKALKIDALASVR